MTDNIQDTRSRILEYWNDDHVESMYDKHLINSELDLIEKYIPTNSKVLDAGCGEGEGSLRYSSIEGTILHAADFSETRLQKAAVNLSGRNNVELKKVDFLGNYSLDKDYDVIVCQRFLINLMEWKLQKKVILDLMSLLKPGGRLIMLEGSVSGVNELNNLRKIFNLSPIEIKWHNRFFNDDELIDFMADNSFELLKSEGLGVYFFMTRGIRPYFDKNLNWDSEFNGISASTELNKTLGFDNKRFSRLKLWVFLK